MELSAHLSVESAHPLPPWLFPEDVNPQRLAPAGTVLLQKVTITGSPPVLLTVSSSGRPGNSANHIPFHFIAAKTEVRQDAGICSSPTDPNCATKDTKGCVLRSFMQGPLPQTEPQNPCLCLTPHPAPPGLSLVKRPAHGPAFISLTITMLVSFLIHFCSPTL